VFSWLFQSEDRGNRVGNEVEEFDSAVWTEIIIDEVDCSRVSAQFHLADIPSLSNTRVSSPPSSGILHRPGSSLLA
jgi:hypothetical protein